MTTLLNTETGEMVETLGHADAERLTTRIRLRLDTIADNYTAVMPMIREAITRQAWAVLGYNGVSSYVQDCFGDALTNLGVDVRRAVVHELTAAGMSTRSIAPVVGASKDTVHRDQAAGVSRETPAPHCPAPKSEGEVDEGAGQTPQIEDAPVSAATDAVQSSEARPETAPAPRPAVTGIDGKTYTPPAPKAAPKPVLDGNDAEYANARQASERLARAIAKLLEFEHPNMRAGMRRYWAMASNEVPPAQRADVTPEQMRAAAQGLLTLADEWNR